MSQSAQPVSTARAAWLLLRLRLRRFNNQVTIGLNAGASKKKPDAKREAVGRKRRSGWVGYLIVPLFLFGAAMNAFAALHNAEAHFGDTAIFSATALLTAFLAALTGDLGIKARAVSALDWDLEWLLTLPVQIPSMLLMKTAEFTFMNLTAWFLLWPFIAILAWRAGLVWTAPLASLIFALPLLMLLGSTRMLCETLLRHHAPVSVLRNSQAVATVLGLVFFFIVLGPASQIPVPHDPSLLWKYFSLAGEWIVYTPFGLPDAAFAALKRGETPIVAMALSFFLATLGGILVLQWMAIRHIVRVGLIGGRADLQGERKVPKSVVPSPAGPPARRWFGGMMGKDLKQLQRDRQMMIGVLVVPLILIGSQLFLNKDLRTEGLNTATRLCAIAFGAGAYVMLIAGSNMMGGEGAALWMLFTFPQPLQRLLLRKTMFWCILCLLYAMPWLFYGYMQFPLSWELFEGTLFALAGLPLMALITSAIVISSSDPLNPEPSKRINVGQVYLCMLIMGAYGGAFFIPGGTWPRIVMVVLFSALAAGLWQRVADTLPYVLDPVCQPPARLSLNHGIAAVVLFFVLQSVIFLIATLGEGAEPGTALACAFALGGACSLGLMALHFWREKIIGLWADLGITGGKGTAATLGYSVACALPCIAAMIVYIALIKYAGWFEAARQNAISVPMYSMVAMVVVAAPICEELIFRGMVFRGLRRSFGLWPSVLASSALFAVVHPLLSVPPVFLLGCCAALACEYSGSILAGMLVHALYNAAVLAVN